MGPQLLASPLPTPFTALLAVPLSCFTLPSSLVVIPPLPHILYLPYRPLPLHKSIHLQSSLLTAFFHLFQLSVVTTPHHQAKTAMLITIILVQSPRSPLPRSTILFYSLVHQHPLSLLRHLLSLDPPFILSLHCASTSPSSSFGINGVWC